MQIPPNHTPTDGRLDANAGERLRPDKPLNTVVFGGLSR